MKEKINQIISKYDSDRNRLMDILLDIHEEKGYADKNDVEILAHSLGISTVEVDETISFYHFFSSKPRAKYNIYLNNSITACMRDRVGVKEALEKACGTTFGNITEDGMFGLYDTSCIGMNDQGPAALINDVIFTNLTSYRVSKLVSGLKEGKELKDLIYENNGDGNNADPDMQSMVYNNIRKGSILLNNDYFARAQFC